MANKPGTKPAIPTTPESFPTNSPQLPSGDFSYILEIVMNMQNQMGRVVEAVASLKEDSKESKKDLKEIGNQVYAAKVVAIVAGGLITVAIAIVGYIGIPILFKIFDVATSLLQKSH